jgi:hypothetical protein
MAQHIYRVQTLFQIADLHRSDLLTAHSYKYNLLWQMRNSEVVVKQSMEDGAMTFSGGRNFSGCLLREFSSKIKSGSI